MIYQRQDTLNLITQVNTTIIGCGGGGTWLGLFLAMAGIPELHLFDHDRIEIHNLNRLPYPEDKIGEYKVDALKELIHTIRPDCKIYTYPFEFSQTYLTSRPDFVYIVVDTPDGYDTAIKYCQDNYIRFTRIAFDADLITVTDRVSPFDSGNRESGYANDVIYIVPAVLSAILGVESLIKPDEYVDLVTTLDDIKKGKS